MSHDYIPERNLAMRRVAHAHANSHRGSATQLVDGILRPELQKLSSAPLTAYLAEITMKLIREEVHGEMRQAEGVDEPRRCGQGDNARALMSG